MKIATFNVNDVNGRLPVKNQIADHLSDRIAQMLYFAGVTILFLFPT